MTTDLLVLRDDLHAAAGRAARRRLRRHVALAVAVLAVVSTGTALAAARYLGDPAPPKVQRELGDVVALQLPVAPREQLNVRRARVVGVTPHAVLYGVVNARAGHFCAELVGADGRIYRFVCRLGETPAGFSVGLVRPSKLRHDTPVVAYGRLHPRAVTARARYDDGSSERVDAGLDRFYLFEPAAGHQGAARTHGLTIEELDASGRVVSTKPVLAPPPVLSPPPATMDWSAIEQHIKVSSQRLVALDPKRRLPRPMSTEPVVYVHGGGTVYVDAGTVGIPALHVRR